MAAAEFTKYTIIHEDDRLSISVNTWGEITVNMKTVESGIRIVPYLKESGMNGVFEVIGVGRGGIFHKDHWYNVTSIRYIPTIRIKEYRKYFKTFISEVRNFNYLKKVGNIFIGKTYQ